MTEAEQLQDHLARLRAGGPLVELTTGQANAQARRLRIRGMSFPDIARTMDFYHGYYLSGIGWQRRMRRMGVPPTKGPDAVREAA